jgi:phage protein D
MNLQGTQYRILYENKNITKDVSDYLISLSYTDKHTGESDEIELQFHDKDLLWQNEWYPDKGAKVSVQIIDGELVLDCGTFTIDENELSFDRSSGDVFSIRGMASGITKALRSKTNTAHENKTLKEICNTVAAKHGLKVQGSIDNIRIARVTQSRESDLAFLHRLAEKYGYTFSARDGLLIFTSLLELYRRKHSLSLDKTECTGFSVKDKSKEVVKQVTVKYHDPDTNTFVQHYVTRSSIVFTPSPFIDKGDPNFQPPPLGYSPPDEAEVHETADNDQQAEAIATTKMIKSIVKESECEVSCKGNTLIVAGNQVELTGFGKFSGIWYVIESSHSLDRSSGYVTSFKANRTGAIPASKHKPKKKKVETVENEVDVESDSDSLE